MSDPGDTHQNSLIQETGRNRALSSTLLPPPPAAPALHLEPPLHPQGPLSWLPSLSRSQAAAAAEISSCLCLVTLGSCENNNNCYLSPCLGLTRAPGTAVSPLMLALSIRTEAIAISVNLSFLSYEVVGQQQFLRHQRAVSGQN